MRINLQRLLDSIHALGEIGGLPGGGCSRIALTPEDGAGRDFVVARMHELGLAVRVDPVGNILATRPGRRSVPPVMTGSHIDTVSTGGLYDGCLGVLAGLEIVQSLNEQGVETDKPLAVAVFSNEEGVRYAPDMMGSLVFSGQMPVQDALDSTGIDGSQYGEELQKIGYAGEQTIAGEASAFVELHIEQGPVLESECLDIGVVEGVQGISWTEWCFKGESNHAGTTPMGLRRDAGMGAMQLATRVRELALQRGADSVATVGRLALVPDLVNVVPKQATLTIDLRNPDSALLLSARNQVAAMAQDIARCEHLEVSSRVLADFLPVRFDPAVTDLIAGLAKKHELPSRRMFSGAGHDAQMMAQVCPSAMIFIPSQGGVSHNVREFSQPTHIAAGANLLMETLFNLAN